MRSLFIKIIYGYLHAILFEEEKKKKSVADLAIECLLGRLAYLSMLTVRVVVLEYSQLHQLINS